MKQFISITLFLILSHMGINAQEVTGTVKDHIGEPIPGANVVWLNTSDGVITKEDGSFAIARHKGANALVVSFIGFQNDTITVDANDVSPLDIILSDGMELSQVNVTGRKLGTMKMRNSVMNEDMISGEELCRAACCNLGESFTTNPSVDVSYSDAATGAKQIKLLGLSGTYVQMLTENIPNYRGAAAPYGLGYVPGPWMHSIQVSKGTSSVKNGYEALTGQINVEFKKPQLPEADWVALNLFGSTSNRYEANADATIKLPNRWSTTLLAHYENETKAHDDNGDGFVDNPMVEQYNFFNRWAYMGEHYVFQGGLKVLDEKRNSGQDMHTVHLPEGTELYTVGIDTRRYELFAKNAYIFNKEKNTNVALITSASWHEQEAAYGHKLYNVDQTNFYASLMFETEFSARHSLSTGLSFNHDGYDQNYRLTHLQEEGLTHSYVNENVVGAYAQYTLNLNDQWMVMAGLRADYSSEHGSFVTPRAHLKYSPNEYFNLRLSAGKGYRSHHVLAENNYLLSSSRQVSIAPNLDMEEAWNMGISMAGYIPVAGKTLNVNAEYYYTDFVKQVVVDMDSNPHEVAFYNLDGRSYSHVFQLEATYPFFTGFSLTAAYRLTDVKSTYGGKRMEKPLTSKYKGLLTASYQTPLGKWQVDATLQLNGGGRMPTAYTTADGKPSWESRYNGFEQFSAQVTRYFRNWSVYVGGENLTNFKQKNPIIDAANPWGNNFDSSMIWGPVHGRKFYIGLRFNIARDE
ncbi:MAG: TonB-dependent receptor [Bacteroides sp.]|nr:TonB-dependent receptor [Bacteroides sp.]